MRKIPIPLQVGQYLGAKNSGRIRDIRPTSEWRPEAACMTCTLEWSCGHVCTLSHIPDRVGGRGACLSIPREPRWQGEGADVRRAARPVVVPRASRATPQTPHRTDPLSRHGTTVAHEQTALPTLRDRADFPSSIVVASLLGPCPTASAPPRLRGNLPRSRPCEILRQAPRLKKVRA